MAHRMRAHVFFMLYMLDELQFVFSKHVFLFRSTRNEPYNVPRRSEAGLQYQNSGSA